MYTPFMWVSFLTSKKAGDRCTSSRRKRDKITSSGTISSSPGLQPNNAR